MPLLLIGYGITCLLRQHALLPGRIPLELHGPKAVALGIAATSLGLFLHCHYFWGNLYHLAAWAVLGKIISLMALIGSLAYLIARVGFLG